MKSGAAGAQRMPRDWLGTVSAACSAMKQTIRGMPVPNLQKAASRASPPVAPVIAELRSPKPVAAGLVESGGRAPDAREALHQRGSALTTGVTLLAALMIPLAILIPLTEHRVERQRELPSVTVAPAVLGAPSIQPEPAPKSIEQPAAELQPSAPPSSAQQASGHAEFAASTAQHASTLDGAPTTTGELSLASLAPADVMALQRELQRRGLYSGTIDGLIGPVTIGGLIEAERQRSQGAQQALRDGRVGAALWSELMGDGRASR